MDNLEKAPGRATALFLWLLPGSKAAYSTGKTLLFRSRSIWGRKSSVKDTRGASPIDITSLFHYVYHNLSLTEILLAALTAAVVVAVVFLVRLFIRLHTTAMEADKTLAEVRVLVQHLCELDLEIKARVEELGDTLAVSRKAADGLSGATMLAASKFLPAPVKVLPFVLLMARFVIRQMKKRKERHGVE